MPKHPPKETLSYLNFNSEYGWKPHVDYRQHRRPFQVGKGEQVVLICEPCKSQIGQFWRFKTKAIAEDSSDKVYALFLDYLEKQDFAGADMAPAESRSRRCFSLTLAGCFLQDGDQSPRCYGVDYKF